MPLKRSFLPAAVVALVVVAGCGDEEDPRPEAKSSEAAHWSYEGAEGPAAWASLTADWARCADGSAQSPIAVEHPEDKPLPDLRFDYRTARVEIEDTGSGIKPENLNRIFEPGFTTKDGRIGMGLGLLIARQIVERHGGRIAVRSQLGNGTCFTVQLPRQLPANT